MQVHRLPEILRARRLTPDWLRLAAAYLGLPVSLPFSIRLPTGRFQFCEPQDAATFWQVFFRDAYPVYPDDKLIVDAGANIGSFTLYALMSSPRCRVIAIEPAPDTCHRLRAMLQEHRLDNRCVVHHAALGNSGGTTQISLRAPSHIRVTGEGEVTVPAVTLDQLLANETSVDLLKIDAEGAEYPVLETASERVLRKVRRIAMEYHPQGNPEAVFQRLRRFGFVVMEWQESGGGYGLAHLKRTPGDQSQHWTQSLTA